MISKEELTGLIQKLVSIESPYYHEEKLISYCAQWLHDAGFEPQIHSYTEDKAVHFSGQNLICTLKGKAGGPKICLNGHLDTVPLCQGWTKNPYTGEIEGDRLYGLGSLDMKSGSAALLLAFREFGNALKASGGDFCGELILTLLSDEEGPYGLGANALIEEGLLGQGVSCSVITEPTAGFSAVHDFPLICLGARGCFVYCVEFFGKSAHASQPETGTNAAICAARFIAESENIKLKAVPPLGAGSFCILKVEADGGACSVPDFARVTVHRHITSGETEETVFAEAEEIIRKAKIDCPYEIKLRPYPTEDSKYYKPYYVEECNPYAVILKEAVHKVCGTAPQIDYFSSIGDFNYLGTRLGNSPALIFGPNGENMHSADEYVSLDSAHKTALSISEFLSKVF